MKLVFSGEFTDLNTYIKKINHNRFAGNTVKQEETERVWGDALEQKCKRVKNYPVKAIFTWYSPNQRKDIDNIAFSKKFILDGLVLAKILKDDSRKFVSSLEDHFLIDAENPRVEVEIVEATSR